MNLNALIDSLRRGMQQNDNSWFAVTVLLGGVFIFALGLYTRSNSFPHFYYTDEKLKVQYVKKGRTDFNHPLLLMGSGRQAVKLLGITDKSDNLLRLHVVGRTVSAVYAALAVVALMGIALLHGGRLAAAAVGLLTALSPLLLTLAHYMKEDTALVFGMALNFLALTIYLRRPGAPARAALGAAAGVALSAKYVGAIALPFALAGLLWPTPAAAGPRWRRLGWFMAGLAAVVLTINFRALSHFNEFKTAFAAEAGKVAGGRDGLQVSFMPLVALKTLGRTVAWPVLALAAGYLALFAATWRRRSASEWMMLLLPAAYFLSLLFSNVLYVRYLLPVVVWLHYWAGMALAGLPGLPEKRERSTLVNAEYGIRDAECIRGAARFPVIVAAALLAFTAGVEGARCANVLGQFADDSRERLARWAVAALPPQAHVLEDLYARLGSYKKEDAFENKMTFAVQSPKWAADFAPFDELRAKGITHVAVCSMAFHRYLTSEKKPIPGHEAEVQKYRTFYERLFKEGELVWRATDPRPAGHHTNPWIYVFKLNDGPPQKNNGALWEELMRKVDEIQE